MGGNANKWGETLTGERFILDGFVVTRCSFTVDLFSNIWF